MSWREFRRAAQLQAAHLERDFPWLLTSDIESFAGTLLANGRTTGSKIRVSHQPNTLPSLGVVAQDLLACELARRLTALTSRPISVEHVWVSYDVASDERFGTARLPKLGARGGFVSVGIGRGPSELLMEALPVPELTLIRGWINRALQTTLQDQRTMRRLGLPVVGRRQIHQNAEHLSDCAIKAHEASDSLVSFNQDLYRRLITMAWGSQVTFVSGPEHLQRSSATLAEWWWSIPMIWKAEDRARRHLLALGLEVSTLQPPLLPFWVRCVCGHRLALIADSRRLRSAEARCRYCTRRYYVNMRQTRLVEEMFDTGMLLPRVTVDDILDGSDADVLAGVGYPGGFPHYLRSSLAAAQLSTRVVPELLSVPARGFRSLAGGTPVSGRDTTERSQDALRLVRSGGSSILHHMIANDWAHLRSLLTQS